ncbi:MAG: L-threonylcarbamoyladenylate synthase [Acidimicrobiia bacterium]
MTTAAVARAARILQSGGLVAFPTETVYGLGADASSGRALARLYAVKQRPVDHPVIVHLGDPDQLDAWGRDVSDEARLLAVTCWPGPLTIVVKRDERVVCDAVTGGRDTVGLRVPDQALALDLLREFAGGIAAPSANRYGRVSPTVAAHVRADLGNDVDAILDGGPCAVGVESTIVDCSGERVRVLRCGGIPLEQISAVLGREIREAAPGEGPKAPGRLAAHYQPRARVVVVGHIDVAIDEARSRLEAGDRTGLLAPAPIPTDLPPNLEVVGEPTDAREYARILYACLRAADDRALDVLVAVPPVSDGIGAAVEDRLRRAAAR